MITGRPTEYTPEILVKTKEYLATWDMGNDVVPSIEALAEKLDVARSTIYKWAEEEGKEDFSDMLGQILAKQARTLINMGLSGKFQPTITKLMMSKHGYVEKQETDLTSGGKPIVMPSELIDKNKLSSE